MQRRDKRTIRLAAALANDESQQAFSVRGVAEIGAVARAVFERVRDEYLSDNLVARILRHTEPNLQLTFVNIQLHGGGAPYKEAKRIKCCASLNAKWHRVYAGRPRADSKNKHIGRLHRSELHARPSPPWAITGSG